MAAPSQASDLFDEIVMADDRFGSLRGAMASVPPGGREGGSAEPAAMAARNGKEGV